ncbi:MAG: hypothetical protein O3A10_02705 [Chloroflexi bacterium]|nr:hypothetical protein [Chloroflexota bacterium]MDA1145184.1 hypothetical protein [Chloroflexota bacterium]
MSEPPTESLPAIEALDDRDAVVVAEMPDLLRVFINDSHWWQNASFALPFLGFIISAGAGLLIGNGEALGFGLFLGVVTLIMVPVVLLTWRGSATSIALRGQGVVALHHGRVLEAFTWHDLRRIERVEYLGNVRHKLVYGDEDRFLTVESEIEEAEALVDTAFTLSGLPRQAELHA